MRLLGYGAANHPREAMRLLNAITHDDRARMR
jgi:hypothetical protein